MSDQGLGLGAWHRRMWIFLYLVMGFIPAVFGVVLSSWLMFAGSWGLPLFVMSMIGTFGLLLAMLSYTQSDERITDSGVALMLMAGLMVAAPFGWMLISHLRVDSISRLSFDKLVRLWIFAGPSVVALHFILQRVYSDYSQRRYRSVAGYLLALGVVLATLPTLYYFSGKWL